MGKVEGGMEGKEGKEAIAVRERSGRSTEARRGENRAEEQDIGRTDGRSNERVMKEKLCDV